MLLALLIRVKIRIAAFSVLGFACCSCGAWCSWTSRWPGDGGRRGGPPYDRGAPACGELMTILSVINPEQFVNLQVLELLSRWRCSGCSGYGCCACDSVCLWSVACMAWLWCSSLLVAPSSAWEPGCGHPCGRFPRLTDVGCRAVAHSSSPTSAGLLGAEIGRAHV